MGMLEMIDSNGLTVWVRQAEVSVFEASGYRRAENEQASPTAAPMLEEAALPANPEVVMPPEPTPEEAAAHKEKVAKNLME